MLKWALAGRIFEFVHGPAVVNTQALPAVVGALLAAIRDEPHIAEKVRCTVSGMRPIQMRCWSGTWDVCWI